MHPLLRRLREAEPVSWVPAIDGWLVSRRSTAIAVMRDSETFTVDHPGFSTGKVIGTSMLSTDGAEHRRHREPFVLPYAPSASRDLMSWTDSEARSLVSAIAAHGSAELRTELATPLAVGTIHRSLGFTALEPAALVQWYRCIVNAVNDLSEGCEMKPDAELAMQQLRGAVERTVATDADSLLARASAALPDTAELTQNAAIVLFGALETTEAMTANALWHLLDNDSALAAVAEDRSLIKGAVEESLRLEPAASVVDRYATRAINLDDVCISEGDLIRVSLAAANRDPEIYDEPDDFRLDRLTSHVSFAQGPHACLGAHVARGQTVAAINAVLDIIPSIRLDPDTSEGPAGLIFRKPSRVNVLWEPVASCRED